MSGALQVAEATPEASLAPVSTLGHLVEADPVALVVQNVETVDSIIRQIMRDGTHYGKIPGCAKLSLWQPGAELLVQAFRLRPRFTYEMINDPGGHEGHREVICTCRIETPDGAVLTEGFGSCSTLEKKYRWRSGVPCPSCGMALRESKKKKGEWYCWAKMGGCGHKGPKPQGATEGRIENPDLADEFHTVLAMARKRALVLAAKTVGACSDRFTEQDSPPGSDMLPVDFEPRAATSRPHPPTPAFIDVREAGRQVEDARRKSGLSPDDINGWLRREGLNFARMEQGHLGDLLAWIRSGPAGSPPATGGDDPIGEMMADLGAVGDPQPKATLEEFAGGSLAALDEDAMKRLQDKVAKHVEEMKL